MINTFVDIFKNKDIRKKILFTLFILLVYRLGSAIVVPGIDNSQINLSSNSLLNMMSLLGGGSIATMSVFALGVGPYITASIIIQLLSMDVIPYLTELSKDGKKGQIELDKITRYLGVVMGIIQSYFIALTMQAQYKIIENPSFAGYLYIAIIFTAGTMFLIWLADQITSKGIGNGMSILIFAGIVADIPFTFMGVYNGLLTTDTSTIALIKFIIYILMYLLIIILVVVMQLGQRRIPIQYTSSNMQSKAKGDLNFLPLKINSASVIPVIFASSIIQAPLIILSWFNPTLYSKVSGIVAFDNPIVLVVYGILIVVFTFFYANLQVDPSKIADNLNKQNTYIPGIRPGNETREYISNVLNRITVLGALELVFIALIPYVVTILSGLNMQAALGGTGIIIVVGIAIETHKQLVSQLTQKSYKGFIGK